MNCVGSRGIGARDRFILLDTNSCQVKGMRLHFGVKGIKEM